MFKRKRVLIILYLVCYFAAVIIYFRSILYLGNLDFPDLGVFPLYPWQIIEQNYYDWQLGGFGSQGSILPYSFIIFSLEHIFRSPSLAERIWVLSLLPIASLSAFYFSHNKLKIDSSHSLIFAILYAFNPITTGLLYMGSVNDTLTMYIFEPILVALVFSIISSKTFLEGIQWSLGFTLVFYYVYSWSPEVIMWIFPILVISLLLWIIGSIRNLSSLKKKCYSQVC